VSEFVRVNPDGSTSFAGWAPHLDLEPLADSERSLIKDVLDASWIRADQEQRAVALAATTLVPDHFREVSIAKTALQESLNMLAYDNIACTTFSRLSNLLLVNLPLKSE
jgi:hypothetical protein